MNYRTKVNAVVGGLVAIGFGGVPGALLGGSLAGYLEGRDVVESAIVGAAVALVAVVVLWSYTAVFEVLQHGIPHWWSFVFPLLTQSFHVVLWATVGGGIGGYVNRETRL